MDRVSRCLTRSYHFLTDRPGGRGLPPSRYRTDSPSRAGQRNTKHCKPVLNVRTRKKKSVPRAMRNGSIVRHQGIRRHKARGESEHGLNGSDRHHASPEARRPHHPGHLRDHGDALTLCYFASRPGKRPTEFAMGDGNIACVSLMRGEEGGIRIDPPKGSNGSTWNPCTTNIVH